MLSVSKDLVFCLHSVHFFPVLLLTMTYTECCSLLLLSLISLFLVPSKLPLTCHASDLACRLFLVPSRYIGLGVLLQLL